MRGPVGRDQGRIRRAADRLLEIADDNAVGGAFVDAEMAASYLADGYDVARVGAAEVDLVDGPHGIRSRRIANPGGPAKRGNRAGIPARFRPEGVAGRKTGVGCAANCR